MFVGRIDYLQRLQRMLKQAQESDSAKPGLALLIRGRRRVGKSRLVEEFVSGPARKVPHFFFAATGRPVNEELSFFAEEAARSNLPGAELFQGITLASWDAALRLLGQACGDQPCVVVLDEVPYLVAQDPGFEGSLQHAFDRDLSRRRVLLIGIGSDISMMEALNEYGRPFHQRATEMVVDPFTPAEVGAMLDLPAIDAFDAWLVTGGLPLVCSEWPPGATLEEFLAQALSDPTSALLVSAERSLAAEFPIEAQAKHVLDAIGGRGERTFSAIAREAGINATSLTRALELLAAKRIVTAERPLSTAKSRETRYRVNDPYLRFWLTFARPGMPQIERGRGADVAARISDNWSAWRGRAIEPVIREALVRLAPDLGLSQAHAVGGYWTRSNSVEVDLVFADREPVAKRVLAVGSIKWRDSPFADAELGELQAQRLQVPGAGASTPLVVVSRSGFTASTNVTAVLGANELIATWRT